ncbi:hypothetical protein M758_11G084200 [Ceratodon purpureus]|nr:hypothetical protein M758_11G084200 [Ceratodon purpureus]
MALFTAPPLLKPTSLLVNLSSPISRPLSIRCHGPSTSSSYSSMPGACYSRARRAGTVCVRAVENSSNATSTDITAERVRMKQELLSKLEETDGGITPEGMEIIGELQKLNPNPELRQVPELVNGCYQVVRSTFKGRAAADAGVFASMFTLGRASFGMFKPLKQDVIIEEGYNHVGQSYDNEYTLAFEISVKNREGESLEFLRGYLVNKGKYSFEPDSEKMMVRFLSSELRPVEGMKEEELRSWKQLFQEENPSMDERGWMSAELPGSDGYLFHLYLDDELRIHQGNFNNVFVMQRLPGPAIPA